MLTVAKLHAGDEPYYRDSIAEGLEDYYLGRGEAPGRWVGRGAERLRLAVGDDVLAHYNDYRLGLLNGTRGTVTSIDVWRGRVTIDTGDGRSVDVPPSYIQAGRLTHGYTTTVHKAQGDTIDAGLLLIDDQSYREAAYTGLSRGRIANRVYVVSDDPAAIEACSAPHRPVDEMATLRAAVGRSAAQEMATPRPGRRLRR